MNSSYVIRFASLVVIALLSLVAACSDGDGPGGSGEPEHDFAFVSYQGIGEPDGETEMMFSEVFADGKPVILNFWAGQCPPCRAEMPYFQTLADEYEDDVILLGIDVGVFTGLGTEDDALKLLDELDIRYPAGRALDRDPLFDYNATGMPTTIFFSAEGEIMDRKIGMIHEDEMRQKLEDLL